MTRAHAIVKEEIVFVRILVPFSLGITVFYGHHSPSVLYQLILINALFFLYLLYLHNCKSGRKINSLDRLKAAILQLLLLFSGFLCVTLYDDHNHSDYYAFKKQNYLKIRIIDEPKIRQNIILFTAEVTKSAFQKHDSLVEKSGKYNFQSLRGKIRVTVIKNNTVAWKLDYGDELIIPAKFEDIPTPLNPFEFDFKNWQAAQNTYYQTLLKQEELWTLNTNSGNKIIQFAIQLRRSQVARFRKVIKNDDAFAVASTLILGYRTDLSAEIMDIYSKTGTIHVLSVSGMHVGLVYLVLNRLLSFFNINLSGRIVKSGLILGMIWFYTLLTGLSPSVLRAAVMISVFIIAKLLNKNANNYNIIAFTAFCLLLYHPFLIWDVGFQLSFMAILGLIYLQPKIQRWLPLKQPLFSRIWSLMAMSLAAQLATFPFSVYYFHQFPLYFLLSNLFISFPSALTMYVGIILLICRLDVLGLPLECLINFMNAGLAKIASLPYSGITGIWLSKTELILLCLSLLLFTIGCASVKKKLIIYAFISFLSFQTMICVDKILAARQKKTIIFSLKKNYGVAFLSANRAVVFTDLKPQSKTFGYYIKPALGHYKIAQIIFREANVTAVLKDNLIFEQLN